MSEDLLDLRKKLVVDLKKNDNNLKDIHANVVVCMDHSGSMRGNYCSGTVKKAIERILPLAMVFDPDQKAPLYIFDDEVNFIQDVTVETIDDAFSKIDRISMGGTYFAPAIQEIIKDITTPKKAGFFSKIFGKKDQISSEQNKSMPTLVLFFTDGDTEGQEATRKAMIEASNHPVFFQFIGIGRASRFLKELDEMSGRKVDNANYFELPSLDAPVSDEELYKLLLKEFSPYIKLIKQMNMI